MISTMQDGDSNTSGPGGGHQSETPRLSAMPVHLPPADRDSINTLLAALEADIAPLAAMDVGESEPATIYRAS